MSAPAAPSVAGSVPAPEQPTQAAAPSPAATPAATSPAVTSPAVTSSAGDPGSDERFVAAVRGQLPEVAVDRRPEEIAELGGAACTFLAAGQQRAAAAAELTGYGVTSTDARELVVLARTFLCRA